MRRLLPALALLTAACGSAPAAPPAVPLPVTPCPSVPVPVATPTPALPRDLTEAKDRVMALVNASDAEGLHQLFAAHMQQLVPVEKVSALLKQFLAEGGMWKSATRQGAQDSQSQGEWLVQAERRAWRLDITLDSDHRIAAISARPPAPPPPVARPIAHNDQPISLPLRGEVLVVWGGDKKEVNHHVDAQDQRRAADLLMQGPDGLTHKGKGESNADYLVYGQDVLSVADGTVETVVDGVPENVPGQENQYVLPGNYVVVRHAPNLFSTYMHLQPGKVRVKVGAHVKRGSVLGLVGNSGHSSEPHLHFQLQDGPDGNTSFGVEPVFERVVLTRDGKTETVSGYTFLKNDRIHSP